MFDVYMAVAWANGHTMHVAVYYIVFHAWLQSNENSYRQPTNYLLLCKMFQFTLSMLGWFIGPMCIEQSHTTYIWNSMKILWKCTLDCQVQADHFIDYRVHHHRNVTFRIQLKWNWYHQHNRLITFDWTSESFMHKWPQWSETWL